MSRRSLTPTHRPMPGLRRAHRPRPGRGNSASFVIAQAPGGDGLGTIGLHLFTLTRRWPRSVTGCAPGGARARRSHHRGNAGVELGLRETGHQAAEPEHGTAEPGLAARRRTRRIHPGGPAALLDADSQWPTGHLDVLPPARWPISQGFAILTFCSVDTCTAFSVIQIGLRTGMIATFPCPDWSASRGIVRPDGSSVGSR